MQRFPIAFGEVIDVAPGAVPVTSADELDEPRFKLFLLKEDTDTDQQWKQAIKECEEGYYERYKQIRSREHHLGIT